jgi:hypothetical protein
LIQGSGIHERFPLEDLVPSLKERSPTRIQAHTPTEGDAFIIDLIARQMANRADADGIRAGTVHKAQHWMQPAVKSTSEPRTYWLPYVAFVAVVKGYVPMDRLAAQPSQKKRARPIVDGDEGAPPSKAARTGDKADASPHPSAAPSGDGDLMEDDE